MTPESWQRIKEVFQAAVELEPVAREAYLEEACRGDLDLRSEIDTLLERDGHTEALVDGAVFEVAADLLPRSVTGSSSGRRIGPYQILREIGRGGMSEIYLAVRADDQYQQEVAIKLIKRGMDSDFVVDRFRQERQILASLDHPNIARLLDGGVTEEGSPYLVMEHIESGLPIDEYCDARKLSLRQRVELFRQVCSAVHYAHRNLVVHRDLKPSNILVTEEGIPKLLDFGIAKLLDSQHVPQVAASTIAEYRLMTPQYASPEQVRGEAVTTASDAYSLGMVLYRLLTGTSAYGFASQERREVERVICEQQPERPSTAATHPSEMHDETGERKEVSAEERSRVREGSPEKLSKGLRGDLDNIVLMALRKEPLRRYGSVEQLSEDLRRYLIGLPVIARHDTLTYRTSKFIERHRMGVVAAALVVLSLLAGMIVSTWQWRKATRSAEEAREERAATEQVASVLGSILRAADPTEGGDLSARDLLDRGKKQISDLSNQPRVQARLREEMGEAYLSLGLFPEAEEQLEGAVSVLAEELDDDHPSLARAKGALGALYSHRAEYPRANALLHSALELSRRGGVTEVEVSALNHLAKVRIKNGELDEAEKYLDEAFEVSRLKLGEGHRLTLESINNLASLFKWKMDYEEAERLYRDALTERLKTLGPNHPDHPEIADSRNDLALLLQERGKYKDAEKLYRQVLDMRLRAQGPDHPAYAAALNNLALLFVEKGEYDEAEPLYLEALDARVKRFGDRHPRVAQSLNNLGMMFFRQHDLESAELHLLKSLEMRQALNDIEGLPESLNNVGRLLEDRGLYAEAEEHYQLAMRALESLDEHSPVLPRVLPNIARSHERKGEYDKAWELHQRALELKQELFGPAHPSVLRSLNHLASVLFKSGDLVEAEKRFREVLEKRRAVLGESQDVASSLQNLATVLSKQGKDEEAAVHYSEAIELYSKLFDADDPILAGPLKGLGSTFLRRGDFEEAERLLRQSVRLRADDPPARLALSQTALARCLTARRQFEEAEALLQQSYGVLREGHGVSHRHTREALRGMVELYTAWNRPVEVARYQDLLAAE